MILNLTGNVKSFSSDEIIKLTSLLSNMRIKGALEGIILEIFADRDEGLVDFDGNKIRVALPEGARRGDSVRLKAESKDDNVLLKVSQKGRQVTIKTPAKIAKEEVFSIKIPEKVDVKEVISSIKDEVVNLKSALKPDTSFKATIDKVERFIADNIVKIKPNASTKELTGEIAKYVRKSGMSFEGKLNSAAISVKAGKAVSESQLKEIQDDIKFKINDIIRELKVIKGNVAGDTKRSESLARATARLEAVSGQLSDEPSSKNITAAGIAGSVAAISKEMSASLPKLTAGAIDKVIDFFIKITDAFSASNVATKGSLSAVIKTATDIKTVIASELALVAKGASITGSQVSLSSAIIEKSDALIEKLMSLNAFLLSSEPAGEGTSAEKTAGKSGTSQTQPESQKGDKPAATDTHKDPLSFIRALKREVETLLHELKTGRVTKPYSTEEAMKSAEMLLKGFTKLIDGIEYQQLTNLKTADGNINYFALPMLFDEALHVPEIVITARKSKKGKGKARSDNRIELFVDLENAGHIKADFNVVAGEIVGNFFSVEPETVEVIERELPSLIECLTRRDFNVVKIQSKKVTRPEKCKAQPEDKLKLEDIKIFDFKV